MNAKSSLPSHDTSVESFVSFSKVFVQAPSIDFPNKSGEPLLLQHQRKYEADIKAVKEAMKILLQIVLRVEDGAHLVDASGQEVQHAISYLLNGSKQFNIPELSIKAQVLATNAIKAKPSHAVSIMKAFESNTEGYISDAYRLISKHLSLENVDIRDVSANGKSPTHVESRNQSWEAFRGEAFVLDQRKVPLHKKASSSNCYKWKGLNFDMVQGTGKDWETHVLDCDYLQTGGVYKWNIKAQDCLHDNCMGMVGVVANVEHLVCSTYLGEQTGGWSLHGNDGMKYDNGSYDFTAGDLPLQFGKGSKITLVLDLTDDGTLSASVDGGTTHPLFSGMLLTASRLGASPGFLPAVSVYHSEDRMQFLGFE